MTTRTKSVLPFFTIIGALVIVSAESAIAAGQELFVANIDAQCKAQYGEKASAHWRNVQDPKSWKCIYVGNPKSISMSQACKRQMGDNYYAATDRNPRTGWRCVRKGI